MGHCVVSTHETSHVWIAVKVAWVTFGFCVSRVPNSTSAIQPTSQKHRHLVNLKALLVGNVLIYVNKYVNGTVARGHENLHGQIVNGQ